MTSARLPGVSDPGARAIAAAVEAGAATATICGHGPSLLAMTTDERRTKEIAKAMPAFAALADVQTAKTGKRLELATV